MILEGEAGNGMVRLGLQIGGEDAALGDGAQLRHPSAFKQVGDERGDEDSLSGPREPGDAEADDGIEQRRTRFGDRILDAAGQAFGQAEQIQGAGSFSGRER